MVFEAHCMSFPCTELLLFNYAKVNTVFHSMAPLRKKKALSSTTSKGLEDHGRQLKWMIAESFPW